MEFEETILSGVVVVVPQLFEDRRGSFMESFRQDLFEQNVGPFQFVQDNQSMSVRAGTIRGLHFQMAPKAQGKLIRCLSGALLDVVVDLRSGSPSFGRHIALELSMENRRQVWIPPGFAHGFCTLESDTNVAYRTTNFYDPGLDRGIFWNDPDLGIDWPVACEEAILSDKDRQLPLLKMLGRVF